MSLPVRGAWIEISSPDWPGRVGPGSLPVRGAWIEITHQRKEGAERGSLPVRGAWIEIAKDGKRPVAAAVAPRTGSVD